VRSRSFVIVATLVVLLVAAAGGIYAYDSGREHQITKGITVGGVPVGGMKEAAARAKLRRAVLEPLNQPVVARYEGKTYKLTPAQAKVGVDIDGSISQAIQRSREGNIFARTARNLQGKQIDEDIKLDINYNHRAITRMVRRISKQIDRAPRDATLNLEKGDVNPTPSATGLSVQAAKLRRQLRRSLLSVDGSRSVKVRTKMVEPKVTSKDLAEKYPAVVIVRRGAFQLSLYKHLKLAKTYGIAVGRVGLETPAGLYHVQNKAINPALDDAELELGRARGSRQGDPGRYAREPAQGPLAGHLRRRRHPRHRRRRLDRLSRLARLHPDADPGRGGALRPGAGQRAGVHLLGAKPGRLAA
jgi:hypothetical protein